MKERSRSESKLLQKEKSLLEKRLSYQEAAEQLGVSEATIRNWVKIGRITAVRLQDEDENHPFILNTVLQKVQEEIKTGNGQWLQMRRNKTYNRGFIVSTEYISSPDYLTSAQTIIECGQRVTDIHWILLEVVLGFLMQSGKVQFREKRILECDHWSLAEELEAGNLILPVWKEKFYELRNRTASVSCPVENYPLLRKVRALQIPWIEGEDFLGFVYSSLSSLSDRKKRGAYYTPRDIVLSLVKQCLADENWTEQCSELRLLDPCCGTGNFLIQAFLFLREFYLKKGWNLEDIEQFLMEKVIYGWDIDPTSLILAQINLILLLQHPWEKPLASLLTCQNSLELLGSQGKRRKQVKVWMEQFDFVLGNPPWGSSLRERGIFAREDSAVLFTQLGVHALKPGGVLGYVLPEAILKVNKHSGIRSFLLEEMKIQEITDWGNQFSGVFTPAISLIAQKNIASSFHRIRMKTERGVQEFLQEDMKQSPHFILNVHLTRDELKVLEHLRLLPHPQFLKGQSEFALGIVTGNNRMNVFSDPPQNGECVLKGNDIFRYQYRVSENYLVFSPDHFQQVAPEELYRAKEKLIYRFINKALIFAYDNQQRLSLNSANILVPHLSGYDIQYVLAILNSRVAQFYHSLSYCSVKVLRQHLESIPLPTCTLKERQTVVDWTGKLLKEKNPKVRRELYEVLDQFIMDLYQLDFLDQEVIRRQVGPVKYLDD